MYKIKIAHTIAKGSENATIRAKQGRTGISGTITDSCGNSDKSEETLQSIHQRSTQMHYTCIQDAHTQ